MQQFDRITRDTQIMAGQACIRGTGIPVHLIANLAAQGTPTADILAQYPLLELEDIVQAMAYTLRELVYVMNQGHYGVKSGLAVIQSGCQLINTLSFPARETEGHGNGELSTAADILHIFPGAIRRSMDALNRLDEWVHFYRDPGVATPEWWREDLAHIVERALQYYVSSPEGAPAVVVQLPKELPAVRSAGQLDQAIGYLLTVYEPTGAIRRRVTAAPGDENALRLEIEHDPTVGRGHITANPDLGLARGDRQLASLFSPGGLYATAALIVERSGGRVEAEITRDRLRLSVFLPIWIETENPEPVD